MRTTSQARSAVLLQNTKIKATHHREHGGHREDQQHLSLELIAAQRPSSELANDLAGTQCRPRHFAPTSSFSSVNSV
ncbi:hypothetical protein [Shewanella nanhaiensis]|uniref:Uncharacterized protein n=1 Tax=Shewanella nanhaiensis TaxID=2864872 RepID=A0ABS7E4I5_9GAMM|nr:hypothetical protein [Shewanella nanhaiensis]MBW8184593.1 hypothetical protein [Shewanella nanhaiensis]